MPRPQWRHARGRTRVRSRYVAVAVLLALVTLGGCSSAVGQERTSPAPAKAGPVQREVHAAAPPRTSLGAPAGRPNIVLVLMDDFSMDLLATMRSARRMARSGASYDHFVVDSLCCVSRSSLM